MRVVPDNREIVGVFERDGVQIGNGKLCCINDKLTEAERTLRMAVHDVTVFCLASVRADFPFLRCSSDEHFARGGASPPQGQPGAGDAAAASRSKVIDFRIGGSLFNMHLLPIHAELFGENHRQRRVDSLAHFRLAQYQRDAIIRCDPHPRVKGIWSLFFLILRLTGERVRRQVEANDKRGSACGTGLQEFTAVYNGSSSHGTPQNEF